MSNQAAEWQAEQIQQEARKRAAEDAERRARAAAERSAQEAAERARAAAERPRSGHTCVTCGKIEKCDAARHGATGGCSYWAASRDSVNHPAHYTAGGVECIEAIAAATTGLQGIEAVCAGNAIKYVWRYSRKNGAEDIEKAIWYLRRLLREIDRGSGEEEAQE